VDAQYYAAKSPHKITLQAAALPGELRQGPDGRAYYLKANSTGSVGGNVGDQKGFEDGDQVTIMKTAGIAILDGGRVFWDRSARAAHFKQVDDADFEAGVAVGDAASAATSMVAKLNVKQRHKVDFARDPFTPVPIGTPAESVLLRRRGGAHLFTLDATNEAQKIDALTDAGDGFSAISNPIFEAAVKIVADDSGTAAVFSLGLAAATHATAFTSIANYIGVQVKNHDLKIYAASKATGGVTVAPTDTAKVYAVGTRFEVWIDLRNPAAAAIYVEGVRVLSGTVFDVSFFAATWYMLAHLVKTAATDTMQAQVEHAWVRTAEQ
jgi:hypothetical protein